MWGARCKLFLPHIVYEGNVVHAIGHSEHKHVFRRQPHNVPPHFGKHRVARQHAIRWWSFDTHACGLLASGQRNVAAFTNRDERQGVAAMPDNRVVDWDKSNADSWLCKLGIVGGRSAVGGRRRRSAVGGRRSAIGGRRRRSAVGGRNRSIFQVCVLRTIVVTTSIACSKLHAIFCDWLAANAKLLAAGYKGVMGGGGRTTRRSSSGHDNC